MKEALKILAGALKSQLSLIALIKKDPMNTDNALKLFQLITSSEKNLVIAFGSELKGKEFKKIESIVIAALTDSQIKTKNKGKEREVAFRDDERLKQRKNHLDKVVAYFNQVLVELGEDENFEIFYTQLNMEEISPRRVQYGIFIRPKNNRRSDYLIISFVGEDLDRRLRNSQIPGEYRRFKDRLQQGIRILKAVAS